MEKILEVKNLRTYFYTSDKVEIPAVDNVSFDVYSGETLCIVGESGCGKSVTSLSIMQLLPTPPAEYVSGEILFCGEDLLKLPEKDIRTKRCNEIAMVFQEPMTALNPVHKIGYQIAEALMINKKMQKKEASENALRLLREVGVPDPERCAESYPHQLSGGMRQRVIIAMAISCNPKLLIADEPTTALDVTIQRQILDLIGTLKTNHGMTVIFVTHDLGVVAEIAHRVIVMYAGHIVEEAQCKELFHNPLHPYTEGLLKCIPQMNTTQDTLQTIEGQVPSPVAFPSGCRFHPRCPYASEKCRETEPETIDINGHKVACHKYTGSAGQDLEGRNRD